MCLLYNELKTDKFIQNCKKRKIKYVTLWKVIGKDNAPSYSFSNMIFRGGWNKSDRVYQKCGQDDLDFCEKEVSRGIHVFMSRLAARHYKHYLSNVYIIKVHCYIKDLVALGKDNDAVFMKIFIPKPELKSPKILS